MTEPTPVDELGRAYEQVVTVLDRGDDDALDDLYATRVLTPGGHVLPVGEWSVTDLSAAREQVAAARKARRRHHQRQPKHDEQQPNKTANNSL